MPRRDERDHVAPEMRARRKTVEKDDGFSLASAPRGVVVEAGAVQIQKLAAHVSP
jgi:hypothetical protein